MVILQQHCLRYLIRNKTKHLSITFLDIEYDLSKVMFIATANILKVFRIHYLIVLKLFHLSGYTDEEKIDMQRNSSYQRILKEYSLTKTQFKISVMCFNVIIAEYTKEAGVRQLERIIAKLMRKTIQVLLKRQK